METKDIHINEGQYLSEILPIIPTNTILDKTICGCGATTLEINSPRHSIIIEPNLPVILGKKAKHPNLLGVHEGVNNENILKHIKTTEGYIKIMTTPESFPKVKKAIIKSGLDLHSNFFLLFDECERTSEDVDYRKSIILPINDFFRCESKAMVSATPTELIDPRFEEQGFQQIKIVPTYDYSKEVILCPTNNVHNTLFEVIYQNLSQEKHFCIFINSTKKISTIIEDLDIKQKSNIYCSAKSVYQLESEGFTSVSDKLCEVGEGITFNKYNFFTSRFYSAVDIELPYKPIVIMLTDLFSAPYSKIDPLTEAVQIVGRFRNGVEKVYHITNYDRKKRTISRDILEKSLEEQHSIYKGVLYNRWVTSTKIGERKILTEALERVSYSEFTLENGEKNYFRYCNYFREWELADVYKKPIRITNEYLKSKAHKVLRSDYFFRTTDRDRRVLNPNKNITQTNLYSMVLDQISRLAKSKCRWDKKYIKELKRCYNIIFEGIQEIGFDGMERLSKDKNLKRRSIEEAIKKRKLLKALTAKIIIYKVQSCFKENSTYTTAEINDQLKKILDRYEIPYNKNGCSSLISLYFEATPYKTARARGWNIGLKKKF